MPFLDIALRNAARGFRVHPLKPQGKAPELKNWPEMASSDPEVIKSWGVPRMLACNVGVVADDRVCILESDNLPELLKLLEDEVTGLPMPIPDCYTVQARENRPHFYFLQTEATRALGNCDLPGVFEFKQHHRYVVAEGSTHPTGPEYKLIRDLPLYPMPDWLTAELRRLYGERRKADAAKEGEPIGYGGRHDFLTSVAGKLRNSGLGADAIAAALVPINESRCVPPLPDEDLIHIAGSVARYEIPPPEPAVIVNKPKPEPAPEPPKDWRAHYHTVEEMENAPPLEFLIDGWLLLDSITAIAAPVAQRKSIIALNVAHALCTGEPLFDHFAVVRQPTRVLYLCPEMGIRSFTDRVRKIGLLPYVGKTLFVRTMSAEGTLELDELTPEELAGAVVIIDTAIRYLKGDENSSEDMRVFAASIFRLLRDGGSAVVLLHHSAKGTKESTELTLENAMRGSGELGAFLSSCWATRLQDPNDEYNSPSYITNVKKREFDSVPFEALSGKSYKMTYKGDGNAKPVLAVRSVGARANRDGRDDEARALLAKHPEWKVREAVERLAELGIKRGRTWVVEQRFNAMQPLSADPK